MSFSIRVVINDVLNTTKNLTHARLSIGQLLHTLQDFYSHSNWIELGKKEINERLGIYEDIGLVAAPNQATCTSTGCRVKKVKCVSEFHRELVIEFLVLVEYSSENHSE